MTKATTQEEKLAAQVVADAEKAQTFGTGASGLSQPMETVTVTITPILKEKNAEGVHFSLPPQDIPFDRPRGTTEGATVISAFYDLVKLGVMLYRDKETGESLLYPLDLFDHYKIKVSQVTGVTLA